MLKNTLFKHTNSQTRKQKIYGDVKTTLDKLHVTSQEVIDTLPTFLATSIAKKQNRNPKEVFDDLMEFINNRAAHDIKLNSAHNSDAVNNS